MFAPWETVLYTSFRYGMQLPLPEFLTKPVWSIILCFDVCYRNNKGGICYQTLAPRSICSEANQGHAPQIFKTSLLSASRFTDVANKKYEETAFLRSGVRSSAPWP